MSIHGKVVGLVGDLVDGNVYLQVLPQEEVDFPCIVFRVLTKELNLTMCGNQGPTQNSVVFECRASTFKETMFIAKSVRHLMDGDETMTKIEESSEGEDFEYVTDSFLEPVYYSIWD